MQIGTSQFYSSSAKRLNELSSTADTLNSQISTGKKLSAPSQDVVAYNRLSSLSRASADNTAYASNVTLAQSLLSQSDTTLGSIATQLQRASELTVQASTGTLNDDDRKIVAGQLQGVLDDLVSLANTADVRGQPLFGAATGDSAVTQAADGTVSFSGTGDPPATPVGDGAEVHATDSAARVFGGISNGSGGTTDVFAILKTYVAALNAGGDVTAASTAASDGLKAAQTQVTGVQGSVGARAARLDVVSAQATDSADVRETERSALEDTDQSTAIVELQKTMTILQAAQASFTKLGQLSLFDYLR